MQYATSPRSEKVFFARAVIPSPPNAVFHERSTVNYFFVSGGFALLRFLDIFEKGARKDVTARRTQVSKLHNTLTLSMVK